MERFHSPGYRFDNRTSGRCLPGSPLQRAISGVYEQTPIRGDSVEPPLEPREQRAASSRTPPPHDQVSGAADGRGGGRLRRKRRGGASRRGEAWRRISVAVGSRRRRRGQVRTAGRRRGRRMAGGCGGGGDDGWQGRRSSGSWGSLAVEFGRYLALTVIFAPRSPLSTSPSSSTALPARCPASPHRPQLDTEAVYTGQFLLEVPGSATQPPL